MEALQGAWLFLRGLLRAGRWANSFSSGRGDGGRSVVFPNANPGGDDGPENDGNHRNGAIHAADGCHGDDVIRDGGVHPGGVGHGFGPRAHYGLPRRDTR